MFLDTQSWFGSLDKEKDGFTEVIEAVESIIACFRESWRLKVVTCQAPLMKLKMQFNMLENSSV